MKCSVCDQFFVEETAFDTLFDIKDLCVECRKKYLPKPMFEVVPLVNNTLSYYYLFADLPMHPKRRLALEKHLAILFEQFENSAEQKASYILIDSDFLDIYKNELSLVLAFNQPTFFSLVRCDFEEYVIFS